MSGKVLRAKAAEKRGMIVAGAPNALAARIIADLGFEAVYLTGAGLTNMSMGVPDLGFVDLSQLAQNAMAIRSAVDLPIIVDADTGFGNAINVIHTVQTLERCGVDAIQIEDQLSPKRCGHFSGKALIPAAEMADKIKAAVDTRRSEDLLIVARTDARTVEGFHAAIDRASLFIEAGADITFVESPTSIDEIEQIPKHLNAPQLINLVVGGKTPIVDQKALSDMGFSLVLYANVALQGAIFGMQSALRELAARGRMDESYAMVASFNERQRLVNKPHFDMLEDRYASR